MKRVQQMTLFTMTLLALVAFGWHAALADDSGSDEATSASKVEEPAAQKEARLYAANTGMPVFVPPKRGAPSTRVGGATRSVSTTDVPGVEALVPDGPGYTLEKQPTLYWYLASDTNIRVDLTIMAPEGPDPALEVTLAGPFKAGIQHIDLAKHSFSLDEGVVYQWYVALIPNPKKRWQGRIAGGVIERIAATDALKSELIAAKPTRTPHVLAENGVWYDAVDDLSKRIAKAPADTGLRKQRRTLLEQVGLRVESASN